VVRVGNGDVGLLSGLQGGNSTLSHVFNSRSVTP
jgi:hypothetical protein